MSIYPVPLQKWFPNPKNKRNTKDWQSYREMLFDYEVLRIIVNLERCDNCGRRCKYNRAWGHHSLPYGYGEVWCSEKCLYGPKKRLKGLKVKKIRGHRKKHLYGYREKLVEWTKEDAKQLLKEKFKG